MSGYSPWQEALWQAMNDVYYAAVYGYGHTRQASPGRAFDMQAFESWKAKVVAAWAQESVRDAGTRGADMEEIPDSLWLYWYERVLDAEPLKHLIFSSRSVEYDD